MTYHKQDSGTYCVQPSSTLTSELLTSDREDVTNTTVDVADDVEELGSASEHTDCLHNLHGIQAQGTSLVAGLHSKGYIPNNAVTEVVQYF